MAILTDQEAADLLNYESAEEMPGKVTSIFLPAVNEYLKSATGKDWGTTTETYTAIDPVAKMAAGILLARWFEGTEEVGKATGLGITGLIAQLGAKYQQELQA
ncbi:head-tail connector protein [Sporomusa malonica]|uniref:Phage gp6-like head-tail connector protein n=1 Tax=Sporomusa malonica TaxID=112901 RepID=A0A1W2ART0_9FIRM|nr:head-tail connector protein [Sporomusa malonica]SMC63294.1 hypothetical protein SAMN04488500_10666 [Sporomusa malonica]